MPTRIASFVFVLLSSFAASAAAQETLGELLDAGAVKVPKEYLLPAMAGKKFTGLSSSGKIEMNIELRADGTVSGYVVAVHSGASSGTVGKWTVDESGKSCLDEKLAAWNMEHSECWFTYRLNGQTYRTIAASEDRSTKVIRSSISGEVPKQ
jgi:hypothetical protein